MQNEIFSVLLAIVVVFAAGMLLFYERRLGDLRHRHTEDTERLSVCMEELENCGKDLSFWTLQGRETEKSWKNCERKLELAEGALEDCRAQIELLRYPPVFDLPDSQYRFRSGSATLTPDFEAKLRTEVAQKIQEEAERCGCDVVEVVGHTDGQPFKKARETNLDRKLPLELEGRNDGKLRAGSNVELGMTRAVSVARVLLELRDQKKLGTVQHIRPYSAGQLIDAEGQLAKPADVARDAKRRRIEIRVIRDRYGAADR
ncbi:MAG: hypothetical protein AAGD06_19410 [Acidobacteriota bacterium]